MENLKEQLERYQRTIFGSVIPVKFVDECSSTDGKVINIHKPEKTIESIRYAYRNMIHERFHVIYDSPAIYKTYTDGKPKAYKHIFNLIEDHRVNSFGLLEYPGVGMYVREIDQERIFSGLWNINTIYAVLICESEGYIYNYPITPTKHSFDDIYKITKNELMVLAQKIRLAPMYPGSSIHIIADDIYNILRDKGEYR